MDEETGLYYYGARYYNPRESIFLSVDPLFEKQYTYQNPIKFIDPTGMEGESADGNDDWVKRTRNGRTEYFYVPDVNVKRHYIEPTSNASRFNGHSIDNILKEFGINAKNYAKKNCTNMYMFFYFFT